MRPVKVLHVVILSFTMPLEVIVENCISFPVAIDNTQFKLHSLNTHMYKYTQGRQMFFVETKSMCQWII